MPKIFCRLSSMVSGEYNELVKWLSSMVVLWFMDVYGRYKYK